MGLKRDHRRGQAAVEFALLLPVLLMVMLGTIDLARGFYLNIEISGASRAGARIGVISDTSDIGDAIRSEPNTAIANTQAVWGSAWKNQPNGCTPTVSASCGDTQGCPPSAFSGGRLACFAVRTCTLSGGGDSGTCSTYGAWGSRPVPGANSPHGLQVLVVYRMSPVTPFVSDLVQSTGNNLYVKSYSLGDELYF